MNAEFRRLLASQAVQIVRTTEAERFVVVLDERAVVGRSGNIMGWYVEVLSSLYPPAVGFTLWLSTSGEIKHGPLDVGVTRLKASWPEYLPWSNTTSITGKPETNEKA